MGKKGCENLKRRLLVDGAGNMIWEAANQDGKNRKSLNECFRRRVWLNIHFKWSVGRIFSPSRFGSDRGAWASTLHKLLRLFCHLEGAPR